MHELTIEGVIGRGWADISSADVRDFLKDKTGDVSVFVNSVGGDVFDGLAMYNQLKRYDRGAVTVTVDGLAASAASVVAMAGDEVVMSRGAQLMIHSPWTITIGDRSEHLKAAKALETANTSILDVYSTRIADREQLEAWVADETWFGSDEAIEYGFADRIEGEAPKIKVPENLFKHTPAALLSKDEEQIEERVWRSVAMGMRADIERRRP